MTRVAITMREEEFGRHPLRHACIDEQWGPFLLRCGLVPVLIPNDIDTALAILADLKPSGIILSGGGDIAGATGRHTPRDTIETILLDYADERHLPVLGVCRGMQVLAARAGSALKMMPEHAGTRHSVEGELSRTAVNSYHNLTIAGGLEGYNVIGRSPRDGVIEAIRSLTRPWMGIGWHPEREPLFDPQDVALVRQHFRTE